MNVGGSESSVIGIRDRRRGTLVRGLLASLGLSVLACAALGVEAYAAPKLTIAAIGGQNVTNNPTPTFKGSDFAEETGFVESVTLSVFEGSAVGTHRVRYEPEIEMKDKTEWSFKFAEPLPQGTFTAQATQAGGEKSPPLTFTIDTTPPQVAITSPLPGASTSGSSQAFAGSAGTAHGDLPTITVDLYAGTSTGSQAISEEAVQASGANWSGVSFGNLSPGTYTAQASQHDEAGNVGTSSPVTFTVIRSVTSSPAPPSASFTWVPLAPTVGAPVTLVSSSTDSASPIGSFEWDLAGNGPFGVGGSVLTTSFSTPGTHVVRLRVRDGNGMTRVAANAIPVAPAPLTLMQPFPIVRVAGTETARGVRLSLLSVQSPVGARVTVSCRGRGCHLRSQSRVATARRRRRHATVVVLSFRAFERALPAGVILEIRVSRTGQVGKYTSFAIHPHRVPTRVDKCLAALDPTPIACST